MNERQEYHLASEILDEEILLELFGFQLFGKREKASPNEASFARLITIVGRLVLQGDVRLRTATHKTDGDVAVVLEGTPALPKVGYVLSAISMNLGFLEWEFVPRDAIDLKEGDVTITGHPKHAYMTDQQIQVVLEVKKGCIARGSVWGFFGKSGCTEEAAVQAMHDAKGVHFVPAMPRVSEEKNAT
jgi:hypothetical protein